MKKISSSILVVLVVSLFTLGAAAQTRILAKADVPFAFSVHEKTFDAGTYVVRQLGANVIRMEETSTHQGITMVAAPAVSGSGEGKLVFHRYGNSAFLRAVVAPAGGYGVELPKSNAERESANTRQELKIMALRLQ